MSPTPSILRGWLAALVALGLACGLGCEAPGPADSDRSVSGILGAQEPDLPPDRVTVEIDLEAIACSAALACGELRQDVNGVEVPTMITALACAHPNDGIERDDLLAYHRRLRCYLSGDPTEPPTWQPPEGVALDAPGTGEAFYSAKVDFHQTVFINSALSLAPMADFAFCHYDGLGLLWTTRPGDLETRRTRHRDNPVLLRWSALISPDGGGGFDCHLDEHSGVEASFPVSVSHDLPSPADVGALPATHAFAVAEHHTYGEPGGEEHQALRLTWVAESTFPIPPGGSPPEPEARAIFVIHPDHGAPADVEVIRTCRREDAVTSEIQVLGFIFRDRPSGETLGAVAVWRELDGQAFDCDREPVTGACELIEYAGPSPDLTACLTLLPPAPD